MKLSKYKPKLLWTQRWENFLSERNLDKVIKNFRKNKNKYKECLEKKHKLMFDLKNQKTVKCYDCGVE